MVFFRMLLSFGSLHLYFSRLLSTTSSLCQEWCWRKTESIKRYEESFQFFGGEGQGVSPIYYLWFVVWIMTASANYY